MASSKRDEMLLRAVQAGKVDEVDDMLGEKNFNVDAADSAERTALWHAASDGDTDMMAVLMKHGANANAPDREGITPLIAALKEKQWAAAELVLDTADLNAKSGERGFTALHSALWMDLAEDSDKRARFLMERWADAKLPDASGVSAVASARDLAAKFPFAQTLLDVIEEYKDGPEARQRYLDAKKQREIKTAFNRENGESVEAPVRASWKETRNGDAVTDTPFTPQQLNQALFNALKSGDYAVMQEALESGAAVGAARDRETNRNLLFAIIDRMADIGHDNPEFPRLTAMFMNYITQGVDPHARDNAGVSVLNHALQRENYLVPGLLVAAGVNVNEKFPQKNGDTPLHVAVELAIAGNGYRLLDTLLNANADPTAANDNGVSAFDIVRRASGEYAPDVMMKISAAPQLQGIFAAERQAHQEKLRAQAKRFKLGGL